MAEGSDTLSQRQSAPGAREAPMDLRMTELSANICPRMPELHELRAGARVRRTHPWDGSRHSGQPVGAVLEIARLYNYGEQSLVEFTDGTHAFAWTLVPVAEPRAASKIQSA